jgi:hypothetical protein
MSMSTLQLTSEVSSELASGVSSELTSRFSSELTSRVSSELTSGVSSELTSGVSSELTSGVSSELNFTHAVARVLERKKIRPRGRTTYGMDSAIPSVILSPTSRSWASATLSHGRSDRGVVAASSIPQGV